MEKRYTSFKELKRFIDANDLFVCVWGAGHLGKEWGIGFLQSKGLKVDCYCDSNKELWNTSINELRVLSVGELMQNRDKYFVFIFIGYCHSLEVMELLDKNNFYNRMDYSELMRLDDVKEGYFPYMYIKPKIAVYTCITGDYDNYIKPKEVSEQWDIFLLTDNVRKYSDVRGCIDIRDIRDYLPKGINDPTRQSRYVKINAHKIFPEYRYSIYYDANTVIKDDFSIQVHSLPKTRIAVAEELFVDSIYEEAMRLINVKRDDEETIKRQMKSYWLQGMPDHFGQYWNYVLLREHNNPICRKLMECWWSELEKFSKRDQLSLPYVVWSNGYSFSDVGIINGLDKFWIRQNSHKRGDSRV